MTTKTAPHCRHGRTMMTTDANHYYLYSDFTDPNYGSVEARRGRPLVPSPRVDLPLPLFTLIAPIPQTIWHTALQTGCIHELQRRGSLGTPLLILGLMYRRGHWRAPVLLFCLVARRGRLRTPLLFSCLTKKSGNNSTLRQTNALPHCSSGQLHR